MRYEVSWKKILDMGKIKTRISELKVRSMAGEIVQRIEFLPGIW